MTQTTPDTRLLTQQEAALRINNRLARLETALSSIARNTCCENCQEAARVAREALGYD